MNFTPAILILHLKNSPHTLPCLDSFKNVKHPYRLYILAVQSVDSQALAKHPTKPTIISTGKNGGFAWANNFLIKQAQKDGYDQFILLNNDTTVDPNFIPPLLHQLKNNQVGMVCPKIYFYPGNEFHGDKYQPSERGKVIWYAGGIIDWANMYASHWGVDEVDHGQFDQVVETDFATGCCLAITQQTIDKVGLMNEKYFLYYEDVDWSLAVKKVGLKIIVESQSVVYHKNAGSTGGSGSPLQQYYQTRNRLYIGLKYAPLKTKLHLLKNAFLDTTSSNPTIRKASIDGLLLRLGQRSF